MVSTYFFYQQHKLIMYYFGIFFSINLIDRFRDDKPIAEVLQKEKYDIFNNKTISILTIKDSTTKETGRYSCNLEKGEENDADEIEVFSK